MPVILSTSEALQASQSFALSAFKHLRPFLFGSKALLHRFGQATEKSSIFVDYYQSGSDTPYSWPGKTSGTLIDTGYTKVWIENALLNYLNDYIGIGSVVAPVSGYTNRVRAAGLVFKTANGVSRTAALYDRDVAVGDTVRIRGTVSSVAYELWSTVAGFAAEATAASIAAASSDANNKANQSASATISQVAGTPLNDISAVASGASYNSLADGYITRTYTITVTQSSTGSNATTARLRVRSADGGDDQDNVVPAAFGSPTSIGTKGLTVTFTDAPGVGSTSSSAIAPDDLVIGQQWTCTVAQAFTAPTPTSGGTYTGATTATYIVKVTRGGKYTDTNKPQVTVSTSTGVDSSGPTDVTATATFITVGTQGVQIKWSQTSLCKGDTYYVVATAAGQGATRTLILSNDLPTGLLPATDLDLSLYIKVPSVSVPATTTVPTSRTNWTQTQTQITVKGSLQLTTTGLTNGGSAVYVPVVSGSTFGKVYVEYREWDTSLAGKIYAVNQRASIAATFGTVDPDNPIAYALDVALQNVAGEVLDAPSAAAALNTDVVKCAVLGGDPSLSASWSDVLSLIAGEEFIYNLVPLTTNSTFQDLVVAHVRAQSTVAVPNYRACMLQGSVQETLAVVNATKTSDLAVALATIAQDPGPLTYTLLTVPANNANFITNGVRAGDVVRYQYSVDAFGNATWTEYTVASVVSESTLTLATGPAGAVSVAQRVEVWRTPTKDELVTQLATRAAAIASDRVCLVWPDTALAPSGATVSGYYVCAMVAGLAGSVGSHQGLRNVEFKGVSSLPRSYGFFRVSQLDALKTGGVFVAATDPTSGLNYVRWAVTTDPTSVTTTEEMVRRNRDMFVLSLLKDDWGAYIGSGNVTAFLAATLKSKFDALVKRLQRTCFNERLGSPVQEATLTSIGPSTTQPDHMAAGMTFTGPFPDNQNDLTITI